MMAPIAEVTPKILDLLQQYNARATFCVVGNRVGSRKDIVKRAVDEGNEIANHTWEHKDTNKLSVEEIKDQITRTNDAVREASGFEIRYIRPTYGNVKENLKQVSRELNMPMVNWTIDSEDWKSKNPDIIYQRIRARPKTAASSSATIFTIPPIRRWLGLSQISLPRAIRS